MHMVLLARRHPAVSSTKSARCPVCHGLLLGHWAAHGDIAHTASACWCTAYIEVAEELLHLQVSHVQHVAGVNLGGLHLQALEQGGAVEGKHRRLLLLLGLLLLLRPRLLLALLRLLVSAAGRAVRRLPPVTAACLLLLQALVGCGHHFLGCVRSPVACCLRLWRCCLGLVGCCRGGECAARLWQRCCWCCFVSFLWLHKDVIIVCCWLECWAPAGLLLLPPLLHGLHTRSVTAAA